MILLKNLNGKKIGVLGLGITGFSLISSANAEVRVVTSIKPIHSLVS